MNLYIHWYLPSSVLHSCKNKNLEINWFIKSSD